MLFAGTPILPYLFFLCVASTTSAQQEGFHSACFLFVCLVALIEYCEGVVWERPLVASWHRNIVHDVEFVWGAVVQLFEHRVEEVKMM